MVGKLHKNERFRSGMPASAVMPYSPGKKLSMAGRQVVVAVMLVASLSACNQANAPVGQRIVHGDSENGRAIIAAVACGVCHSIPGITGANGIVGPPLVDFARRQFIAGVLPNRPDILTRWVREAPSMIPATGMPSMPIDEQQARDIAAYLYTLR